MNFTTVKKTPDVLPDDLKFFKLVQQVAYLLLWIDDRHERWH